jgi:hypothetical protein
MRYYLDTEFFEDGRTIDLISIGVVCEDGREFYAVSKDAELHRVSEWVRTNVLEKLPPYSHPAWMRRVEIRDALLAFVRDDGEKPEVWAYYADYDWVAVAQLFGTMMHLPKHFPMFCMDLKQLAVSLGNPRLPVQGDGEHNALDDARWNKQAYDFLRTTEAPQEKP